MSLQIGEKDRFLKWIFDGLENSGSDLDSACKFIENPDPKRDLAKFGPLLFEVLILGRTLESEDRSLRSTKICVLSSTDRENNQLHGFQQLFAKLVLRYSYLSKSLEETMGKLFVSLKRLSSKQLDRFAQLTSVLLTSGLLPHTTLQALLQNADQINDGSALNTFLDVLVSIREQSGAEETVISILDKSAMISRLTEFFQTKCSPELEDILERTFKKRNLCQVIQIRREKLLKISKDKLFGILSKSFHENRRQKVVDVEVRESTEKLGLSEKDALDVLWTSLLCRSGFQSYTDKIFLISKTSDPDPNKLIIEIQKNLQLLSALSCEAKSQISLLTSLVQSCQDCQILSKYFLQILLLFMKSDVISENSVVMWHKERSQNLGKNFNDETAAQTSKDKQIPDNRNDENVLKKMQVIVDWIQNVHQDKPPLHTILCEDLPIHPYLKKTNLVHLLKTSSTLESYDEPTSKICRFDSTSKEKRIENLTKFYSENQSEFVVKIEELICDHILCELKLNFYQNSEVECAGISIGLFNLLVKVFSRYLVETEFQPKIIEIFRKVVRHIHQTSQSPAEFYPPCLVKLASLITLHQDVADNSLVPHLKRELFDVMQTEPICGKVMLLLFPDCFCLDYDEFGRNSALTCMSSTIAILDLLK